MYDFEKHIEPRKSLKDMEEWFEENTPYDPVVDTIELHHSYHYMFRPEK